MLSCGSRLRTASTGLAGSILDAAQRTTFTLSSQPFLSPFIKPRLVCAGFMERNQVGSLYGRRRVLHRQHVQHLQNTSREKHAASAWSSNPQLQFVCNKKCVYSTHNGCNQAQQVCDLDCTVVFQQRVTPPNSKPPNSQTGDAGRRRYAYDSRLQLHSSATSPARYKSQTIAAIPASHLSYNHKERLPACWWGAALACCQHGPPGPACNCNWMQLGHDSAFCWRAPSSTAWRLGT